MHDQARRVAHQDGPFAVHAIGIILHVNGEQLGVLARVQTEMEAKRPPHASAGVTMASPTAAKIALFRSLFRGRGDVFPRRWDEYDYAPFFATLRQIGYDRRISVEASTQDFPTDAPLAITLLRRAFQ